MKTFYINDCKEEAPVGVCECLFDSLIASELTKEELLGTDLTFDYRKAKGIPETQLSEDKNLEIMGIMYNSMGVCSWFFCQRKVLPLWLDYLLSF